jgi:hypothetical protein
MAQFLDNRPPPVDFIVSETSWHDPSRDGSGPTAVDRSTALFSVFRRVLQYFLIFFVQTMDKFPPSVDFIVDEAHSHAGQEFWVDMAACARVATFFWWSDAISACPYPNRSFLDKLPLTRKLYRS